MKNKTSVLKGDTVKRNWHLVDLSGQTLGRICVDIANLLMGKHKTTYSAHRDDGDYVVAINASQIKVTGHKAKEKMYYHHTTYAGHLKELTFSQLMAKDPRRIISHGVAGMLPKNRLRDLRLRRLKIFAAGEHPYSDKFKKS